MINSYSKQSLSNYLLYLYIALLPWDPVISENLGLPTRITLLFIPAFVFILIYSTKGNFKIDAIVKTLYVYILYSIVTIAWTISFIESIDAIFRIIILSIVYIYVLNSRIDLNIYINIYLVSIFFLLVFTFIEPYFWRDVRLTVRPYYNPSWFGAYLFLSLIFLYLKVRYTKLHVLKNIYTYIFLVAIIIFVISQSRNVLVSFIMAFVIVLMVKYFSHLKEKASKVNKKILLNTAVVLSIIITIGIYIYNNADELIYISRILYLFSGDEYMATAGRTTIWEYGFNMIDNLYVYLFGLGIGTFNYSMMTTYGWNITAHSLIVQTIIELGLVGILILIILFASFIKLYYRTNITINTLLITMILMSFGNDIFYYNYWWVSIYSLIILNKNINKLR